MPYLKEEIAIATRYHKLNSSVRDHQNKIKKLDDIKEQLSEERYQQLREDYTRFLDQTKPTLAKITENLEHNLSILDSKWVEICKSLSSTQRQIAQEEKLVEVEAITRSDFDKAVEPLKSKEKSLIVKKEIVSAKFSILRDAKAGKINIEQHPVGTLRQRQKNNHPPKTFYKNPSLALVFSFLFAGAGQIYNGQITKGIIFLIIYTISALLMLVVVGWFTTPILWILGMVDAYYSAKKVNEELAAQNQIIDE